jgi:hypothetical protein
MVAMADRLYLSLWYPNFRLEALPAALTGVLRQFSLVGAKRVAAASAYPINFTEAPTYQRIYVDTGNPTPPGDPIQGAPIDSSDSAIENAVAEATEQLHDDMAYEFEMRWQLWTPNFEQASLSVFDHSNTSRAAHPDSESDSDDPDADFDEDPGDLTDDPDSPWKLRTHTVRILGFGPRFDVAGYEQNGHLLVDFGLDTPWVLDTLEDDTLDEVAQVHIHQNVEKLLAFTLLVEKNCGISSRLLWTESGEPLAEKLIARLQRVN